MVSHEKPGRLYFYEEGRSTRAHAEELGRFAWAQKKFLIEEDGLDGVLFLCIRETEANDAPLVATVNGEELVVAPGKRDGPGFRWRELAVPGRLLRRGEVEVVLRSENLPLSRWALSLECPNDAARSAKSTDQGRTWQRWRMGTDYTTRGEYLVRLWLPQAEKSHWDGRIEFRYDDPAHPHLRALREAWRLDEVVAGKSGDWARLQALRDFVTALWVHHSGPYYPPWDAATIVELAQRGMQQSPPQSVCFCVQFAIVFCQVARACGHYARGIVLRCDHPDFPGTGHFMAEAWCGDLNKWVLMDPDFGTHYERADAPQSALELHRLCLAGRGAEAACVEGPSFGTNPYIPRGFHTALPRTGFQRWGVLPRADFVTRPELFTVEHGVGGDFRDTCFVWWQAEGVEPRRYFPYYTRDEAQLNAPPPG